MEKDICPVSEFGTHRYFIFKTADVFLPLGLDTGDGDDKVPATFKGKPVYVKTEVATLGCNCGSVIQKEVVKK